MAGEEIAPAEVLARYPRHDRSIPGLFRSRMAVDPDRAVMLSGGRWWSWQALDTEVDRTASGLVAVGVRHGDRVAIMARNGNGLIVSFLALQRIGAITVPVNVDFGVQEAGYIFRHAEVTGVLASRDALDVARQAVAGTAAWVRDIAKPWLLLEDLPPLPDPDDCCMIMYTSGTTGFPKGVMHSQRNFVTSAEGFVGRLRLQPTDRLLVVLPLFHVNALFYSFGGALAAGASFAIAEKFSASRFWQIAAAAKATQVNMVAAMGAMLVNRPAEEFVPGHMIRKIYCAPLSAAVAAAFQGRFGVPLIVEGYGMTEIPGVASQPLNETARIGSFGKPSVHPNPDIRPTDMRVVSDEGRTLGNDEVGELLVRTPTLMQGYYRDPDQTAKAVREGWFATGDLVRRDADGWHWFIGRRKDIIRRRGENISGAELDRILAECPAVQEAAAIAVPSVLGEDDILVALVPRDGMVIAMVDILAWCRVRLSPAKQPRYFLVVDDLPRTPTHRVAKYKMRPADLVSRAVDAASLR